MSTHEITASTRGPASAARRRISVVHYAAGLGAALLAFEAYILIKWVAGPDFKRVPYGPSVPPTWMKVSIITAQPLAISVVLFLAYRLLLRPWRRERAIPFWGLLIPVLLLTGIYDPLNAYFHYWYGYNAYFVNFGSPLPGGVPGWQSFHQPGAMVAYPILFIPFAYVMLFMFTSWLGARLMRLFNTRWPRVHVTVVLVSVFAAIFAADVVIEGLFWMRLGWYAETGRSIINSGSYYQLPWRNTLAAAFMWTILAAFCYYRNDRGQTIVERGLEQYSSTSARAITLRFLAVLAGVQVIMFAGYHVPVGLDAARNDAVHWPQAMASKSYWNDHTCGVETHRRCP